MFSILQNSNLFILSMRYFSRLLLSLCWIFILAHELNASLESDDFPTLQSNITYTFPGSFEFCINESPVTREANKSDCTSTMQPIICRTWFIMFLWVNSEGFLRIKLISGLMFEATDMESVVDATKIINWYNGGMVVNLFLFSSNYFVAVSWLFSRYSFVSMTAYAKLFMVVFYGVETLKSALSVCTGV